MKEKTFSYYDCVFSLSVLLLNEKWYISLCRLKSILDHFASLSCGYMEITTFKNIYFCARSSKDAINNSDVQLVKF